MDYKARITHLYKNKDQSHSLMQADIDVRVSDTDISNGEPPFYYQVGNVVTPSISCANNQVTIVSKGADSIYYTIDGSAPSKAKTKYTAPFAISATVTVKAIAYLGELESAIASQNCTYTAPPAAPTISCENNTVTITGSGTATYYTTDSTEPDNTKTKYSAPFAISATTTVKAVSYNGTIKGAVATQSCTYVEPSDPEVIE